MDVLEEKAIRAVKEKNVGNLVLGGGVSRNSRLRERLETRCRKENIHIQFPPPELCTDNAAMIAACGTYLLGKDTERDLSMNPEPNLPLV
jgi:N6-L-threonylcarbamoyladenine synthase